jgi:hypothetical protein
VESGKNQIKTRPKITEAAERTNIRIRELQLRLSGGREEGVVVRERQSRLRDQGRDAIEERPLVIPTEPEKQPQDSVEPADGVTAPKPTVLNEIRSRVVDGVAERILRQWGWPLEESRNALENARSIHREKPSQESVELVAGRSASEPTVLNEIRSRVVDGVAERILREWGWPLGGKANGLENAVVERLISRMLERLSAARVVPQGTKGTDSHQD